MEVLTLGGKFADAQNIEGLNSGSKRSSLPSAVLGGLHEHTVLDHKANAAALGHLQEILAEPFCKEGLVQKVQVPVPGVRVGSKASTLPPLHKIALASNIFKPTMKPMKRDENNPIGGISHCPLFQGPHLRCLRCHGQCSRAMPCQLRDLHEPPCKAAAIATVDPHICKLSSRCVWQWPTRPMGVIGLMRNGHR